MITWWHSNREGTYFGILGDENGAIIPGHEVNHATFRTREQIRRQFPEDWIVEKEESIHRYRFDTDRPQQTWADLAVYTELMANAQQQIARDNIIRRQEGLAQIPGEEEEDKPKSSKWLDLDASKIPPREQPRFWIPYQTGEEITMRLQNSIICVHSRAMQVHRVEARANERDWLLYLLDGESGRYILPYNDPAVDLRSPEPGYGVNKEGVVSYLVRRPERMQRQGMCTENTLRKNVGKKTWSTLSSQQEILHYLGSRKTRPMTKAIQETMEEGLLHNVLLSPKVALVNKTSGIYVEYKGRNLGRVRDQGVILSDEDKGMSHIRRDLEAVHLEA